MKEKMKAFWNEHSDEIVAYVTAAGMTAVSMVVGYKVGMLTEQRNFCQYALFLCGKKLEEENSK